MKYVKTFLQSCLQSCSQRSCCQKLVEKHRRVFAASVGETQGECFAEYRGRSDDGASLADSGFNGGGNEFLTQELDGASLFGDLTFQVDNLQLFVVMNRA